MICNLCTSLRRSQHISSAISTEDREEICSRNQKLQLGPVDLELDQQLGGVLYKTNQLRSLKRTQKDYGTQRDERSAHYEVTSMWITHEDNSELPIISRKKQRRRKGVGVVIIYSMLKQFSNQRNQIKVTTSKLPLANQNH